MYAFSCQTIHISTKYHISTKLHGKQYLLFPSWKWTLTSTIRSLLYIIKVFTNTFAVDCHLMMDAKIGKLDYIPANFLFSFKLKSNKIIIGTFLSSMSGRNQKRKLKMAISMCCGQLYYYIFFFTYKVGMSLLMTYTPNTKCISHSHPQPAVEHIHIGSCTQLLCTAVDMGDTLLVASPKVQLLIDQNRLMVISNCWLV